MLRLRLCAKSQNIALLGATSVFYVSLLMDSEQKHNTEIQRSQAATKRFLTQSRKGAK
jgi:hypothetical protein